MTLDNDDIVEMIENYDKQSRAIKNEALRMCWYMRGSINYSDAMMLGPGDRDLISQIIKDNIETTEKTKLPFF